MARPDEVSRSDRKVDRQPEADAERNGGAVALCRSGPHRVSPVDTRDVHWRRSDPRRPIGDSRDRFRQLRSRPIRALGTPGRNPHGCQPPGPEKRLALMCWIVPGAHGVLRCDTYAAGGAAPARAQQGSCVDRRQHGVVAHCAYLCAFPRQSSHRPARGFALTRAAPCPYGSNRRLGRRRAASPVPRWSSHRRPAPSARLRRPSPSSPNPGAPS